MSAKLLYLGDYFELPTKAVDKSVDKDFLTALNCGFYYSFINLTKK